MMKIQNMKSLSQQSAAPYINRQNGYVLITAMIFLAILTLVAVVSSQSTTFEYKMSTNLVLKDRAFQSSETGRTAIGDVLDAHIFERGWDSAVNIPSGMAILDKDTSGAADDLYLANEAGEDLLNDNTLATDATYQVDANNDGDYTDGGDINATVSVIKTQAIAASGSGTAMSAGYEGLGKSVAAGGLHMYFELRGRGNSATGAQSVTASEYRVVVKN
jgi:hypothetical protein